jgi:hypothetical protein
MSQNEPLRARSLRMAASEVKARLDAGEPILFLDARSQKAWDGSDRKITGAVRIRPLLLSVAPDWNPAHLTVIYCA